MSDGSRPMMAPRQFPERWSLAFLLVLTCVVVWTQVDRYLDPVGEKTVILMEPGAADFAVSFMGARALLRGVNPYWNDVPEFQDPYENNRGVWVAFKGDRKTSNFYPPTLLVLHVPFALATSDWREAGRLMFKLNVALLFLLAWLCWWLLARIGEWVGERRASTLMLIPLLFFLLTANGESNFALERGQSDIVGAALCWGALATLLVRRIALASFLATTALLTKGYSALFTIGLLLLIGTLGQWRRGMVGAAAPVALLMLPVLGYLSDASDLLALRAHMHSFVWYNHGFANVFWNISPELATPGRWGMMVVSGLATLICWWRFRRAFACGLPAQAAFWGVMFATCSLATMVGGANTSLPYNLIYLLPGVLVIFALIGTFTDACALPPGAGHAVAASALVSGVCLLALKPWTDTVTVPGIGLVLFILIISSSLLAGMLYEARMKNRTKDIAPGIGTVSRIE